MPAAGSDEIELVNSPSPERVARTKREPAVETEWDLVASPASEPPVILWDTHAQIQRDI